MSDKSFGKFRIFAGIAFIYFALAGIDYITDVFRYQYEPTLFYLLAQAVSALANIFVAIVLFSKINKNLIKVGLLILAIMETYCMLDAIVFQGQLSPLTLVNILEAAAVIIMFIIVATMFSDKETANKELWKRLWFLPAACAGGGAVIGIILCILIGGAFFRLVFNPILLAGEYILLSLYIVFPNGFENKKHSVGADDNSALSNDTEFVYGYIGLAKHILLMIFTFGIWWMIWIYKTTAFLNCLKDSYQRGAVAQLLLCIFVPFYHIYWAYESAKRVDELAEQKGIGSNLKILCLITAIVFAILPPMFMQDKINTIVITKSKGNDGGAETSIEEKNERGFEHPENPQKVYVGEAKIVAEDLKTYKDLLDNGVITQEEYDIKKKQILDL